MITLLLIRQQQCRGNPVLLSDTTSGGKSGTQRQHGREYTEQRRHIDEVKQRAPTSGSVDTQLPFAVWLMAC
ncbi:hypothetical protein KCP77_17685 [Salmonella enterica subsp. enterica]|nr:hypothetical protein KCP77_17685 [Salmonella enterica subsp. enterica]